MAKTKPVRKKDAFIAGLLDGKSPYRAAKDAGYSPTVNGAQILEECRKEFQDRLRRRIPATYVIDRLMEGMEATQTDAFLNPQTGTVVYSQERPDFHARVKFTDLTCKLMGLMPEKRSQVTVTGPNDLANALVAARERVAALDASVTAEIIRPQLTDGNTEETQSEASAGSESGE